MTDITPSLTFSPGDHVYKWEGVPAPSTTQIIEAHHFCDEFYRERGKFGHKAVELYRKGVLDEDSLDPQLRPYLEAYKRFEQEAPHVCGVIDIKLGGLQKWHFLQIAGYVEIVQNGVDVWGCPFPKALSGSEVMGYHPTYCYTGTVDIIQVDAKEGHILYLRNDETYRIQPVDKLRHRRQEFLTLASAYHIRKGYGI